MSDMPEERINQLRNSLNDPLYIQNAIRHIANTMSGSLLGEITCGKEPLKPGRKPKAVKA